VPPTQSATWPAVWPTPGFVKAGTGRHRQPAGSKPAPSTEAVLAFGPTQLHASRVVVTVVSVSADRFGCATPGEAPHACDLPARRSNRTRRARSYGWADDGCAVEWVPAAEPTLVISTTGAGDAASAGLLYGLAEGTRIRRATRLGARFATATIEGKRPSAEEARRWAAELAAAGLD
jgi:hypothetical protein